MTIYGPVSPMITKMIGAGGDLAQSYNAFGGPLTPPAPDWFSSLPVGFADQRAFDLSSLTIDHGVALGWG